MLVLAGLTPAAASASVHVSELGTNLASGVSHWRLKNVDWRVVARIAGPGAIGAFIGATVLSHLSTEAAAPIMAFILAALGVYIIVRFVAGIRPTTARSRTRSSSSRHWVLFAGFVDATGGGGWGPVATPALLADGRMEPRKVIGSIDTAEFAVSAAASLGFILGLGAAGINWGFATCAADRRTGRRPAGRVPGPAGARTPAGRGCRRHDRADQRAHPVEELRCRFGVALACLGAIVLLTVAALYLAVLRSKKRTAATATGEQQPVRA